MKKRSKKTAVILSILLLLLAVAGYLGYRFYLHYQDYKAAAPEIRFAEAKAEAEKRAGCPLYVTHEEKIGTQITLYDLSDAPEGGTQRAFFLVQPDFTDRFGLTFYKWSDMNGAIGFQILADSSSEITVDGAKVEPQTGGIPQDRLHQMLFGFFEDLSYYTPPYAMYAPEQWSITAADGSAPLMADIGKDIEFAYMETPAEDAEAIRAMLSEKLVREKDADGKKVSALKMTQPLMVKEGEALIYQEALTEPKKSGSAAGASGEQNYIRLVKDEEGAWKQDKSLDAALEENQCPELLELLGELTDQEIFKIPEPPKPSQSPYYIKVNRLMNTVTIYGLDGNGEYSVPVKAMVCSVGREGHETPLGDFSVMSFKAPWCYMIDGSYGQYATGFRSGGYLFHSICYTAKSHDAMMRDEYNLLGDVASLGCVRLQVADAKWIYDNCPVGTGVKIYEDENPGPLGKPEKLIPEMTEEMYNGWDPSDPAEGNPWRE